MLNPSIFCAFATNIFLHFLLEILIRLCILRCEHVAQQDRALLLHRSSRRRQCHPATATGHRHSSSSSYGCCGCCCRVLHRQATRHGLMDVDPRAVAIRVVAQWRCICACLNLSWALQFLHQRCLPDKSSIVNRIHTARDG